MTALEHRGRPSIGSGKYTKALAFYEFTPRLSISPCARAHTADGTLPNKHRGHTLIPMDNNETEILQKRLTTALERIAALETGEQKLRARSAVSSAVATGKMPKAKDTTCLDCTGPATEYDHYAGYDPANALNVQPVCKACHSVRGKARGELGKDALYDKRIPVALTAAQVAAIDVAAESAGLSRSAWIRTTLLKAASSARPK